MDTLCENRLFKSSFAPINLVIQCVSLQHSHRTHCPLMGTMASERAVKPNLQI